MIIEKTDRIKPNTTVYIKNGNWTHYFLKDSATGNLLGVIPTPNDVFISVIPTETTYNDLHENDSISIFKDSIEASDLRINVSHIPQIKIFRPNELLTDGESIFITNDNTIKIVANPESFKQYPIKVINYITNEKSTIMANKLKPMASTMNFMKYKTRMMTKMKESIDQQLDSKLNNVTAENSVFNVNYAITIAKLLLIQNLLTDIDKHNTSELFDDIMLGQYTYNPNGYINHLVDQMLKHIQLPTTDYSKMSIKDKEYIIKSTLSSIEKENNNNDDLDVHVD